jgi:2-(1,2-epoxy-1,2-dihydrophenyl)acetyl-CoA isomerase
MPNFETIRYETEGGLCTITLARPDKRNAINRRMFEELGDAAELAGSDPDVRAVVVIGEGPSFSAGIDLSLLAELAGLVAKAEEDATGFHRFVEMAQRPYASLAAMPKPTVAAVRGHAVGAGFQLALACDLIVAAEDASFAMLEARYGLVPDLGGMHRLARLLGPARTKEIVWSARSVEAAEALAIGLINYVFPTAALASGAERLARQVSAHSPVTTGLAKTLIDGATEVPLYVELGFEAEAQTAAIRSEDHKEAVAAFLERRAPNFKGR